MPVPSATGHPAYSGTFIPEVWSGKLLVKFYDATVVAAIANTDYEGEIKNHGDKVIIRQTPDIEIRDYYKGMNLQIQRPEKPVKELDIDKGKYFNFILDDIDKYQSDIGLMDDWSNDASEQMKIKVDTEVLADIYDDVSPDNAGATAGRKSQAYDMGYTTAPESITTANVLTYIVNAGVILDEQNVPGQNRWFVIPAWFQGCIKLSDLKDASLTGDAKSTLRNGRIGMIDRFTFYMSNLVYSVTDTVICYHCLFGQRYGLSFAAQMTEMESLRAESTFGTLVRGLNVYGYEVLKPEAVGDLYCTKGS